MSRKEKKSGKGSGAATVTASPADGAQPSSDIQPRAGHGRWIAAGVMFVVVIAIATYFVAAPHSPSPEIGTAKPGAAQAQPAADYVGAATCKTCHEKEYDAWSTSHHKVAMQELTTLGWKVSDKLAAAK